MHTADDNIYTIRTALNELGDDGAKEALDELEEQFHDLQRENRSLGEDVDELEADADAYRDQEKNGHDVVIAALPRDLDYGHALELRDLILNWNRDHRFLPTEPGL